MAETFVHKDPAMVACPICNKSVKSRDINNHIDSGCESFIATGSSPLTQLNGNSSQKPTIPKNSVAVSDWFKPPGTKRIVPPSTPKYDRQTEVLRNAAGD